MVGTVSRLDHSLDKLGQRYHGHLTSHKYHGFQGKEERRELFAFPLLVPDSDEECVRRVSITDPGEPRAACKFRAEAGYGKSIGKKAHGLRGARTRDHSVGTDLRGQQETHTQTKEVTSRSRCDWTTSG